MSNKHSRRAEIRRHRQRRGQRLKERIHVAIQKAGKKT